MTYAVHFRLYRLRIS